MASYISFARLEQFSHKLIPSMLATMFKTARCILAANCIECTSCGFNQCLVRASLSFTQDVLYTFERLLLSAINPVNRTVGIRRLLVHLR
jgi:hypothetical protein